MKGHWCKNGIREHKTKSCCTAKKVSRVDADVIVKLTEFIRKGFAERCPHEGFNDGYRLALTELKKILDESKVFV